MFGAGKSGGDWIRGQCQRASFVSDACALDNPQCPTCHVAAEYDRMEAALRGQGAQADDHGAALLPVDPSAQATTEALPNRERIISVGAGVPYLAGAFINEQLLRAAREALTVAMEYLARPKRIADHDNWPYDDLERLIADLADSGNQCASAERAEDRTGAQRDPDTLTSPPEALRGQGAQDLWCETCRDSHGPSGPHVGEMIAPDKAELLREIDRQHAAESAASLVPSVGVEEILRSEYEKRGIQLHAKLVGPRADRVEDVESHGFDEAVAIAHALIAAVRAECQRIEKDHARSDQPQLRASESDQRGDDRGDS